MASRPRTKIWYKRHAIALAKELARRRGVCAWCGIEDAQLQGSHIIPEQYESTAADIENILCLCAGCHRLRKHAWHQHPVKAVRWLDQMAPGLADRLMAKAEANEPVDWQSKYETLKSMRG